MAIVEALRRTNGNKQEAAHQLGVDRQTLYSKIKKYRLEVKKTVEARPL
jgi:transcriptional regulator of acetoin/glycerol metabolism